jgi:4-hydroxybenzoate polyprenyltransferase
LAAGIACGMLEPTPITKPQPSCAPAGKESRAMSLPQRFWIYQRERFPLLTQGILVAVIAAAGVGYSLAARGATAFSLSAWLVAYIVALGFFFQLRVADEYKDYADDVAYRPYRPVPRGLIRLRELAYLALATGVVQALLSLWLAPGMLVFLVVTWVYIWLMRCEFFVPQWLKAHPLLYMLSHMVVLPLIFLYITACDWYIAGAGAPAGLAWFLATGYGNGMVFEIGRKVRAPDQEEVGVETYSVLWGPTGAVAAWLAVMFLAGLCAVLAAWAIGWFWLLALIAAVMFVVAAPVAWRYVQRTEASRARWVERMSALWLLAIYSGVGILPAAASLVGWR